MSTGLTDELSDGAIKKLRAFAALARSVTRSRSPNSTDRTDDGAHPFGRPRAAAFGPTDSVSSSCSRRLRRW
jgi:hypothetical protein